MDRRGMSTTNFEARDGVAGRRFALLALVFLSPWAQGQAAQETLGQLPAFHAKAEEVSLDLVVHDKKNRPVSDLTPNEIAITDDGTPVTLTDLRFVNNDSGTGRLITMVFDQLDPNVMKGARQVAEKVLKMIPENGFSVAVLSVDGRLRLQEGYTFDRNALEQAVKDATGTNTSATLGELNQPEKELVREAGAGVDLAGKSVNATDRIMSRALLTALQESEQIERDEHAQPSLAALWALVQSQQQIGQRKALIFFTHSRQMDSSAQQTLQSIVGAANRAGVSIYVIDLNGLDNRTHEEAVQNVSMIGMTPGAVVTATGMTPLLSANEIFTENSRTVRNSEDREEGKSPVQIMAEGTGGSFIESEDSLRKPLERMLQDLTTYYQASYVPSIQDYDGKYHSVAVKPLRAGLTIRSSAGYFALPPNAGIDARPFELPLLKILAEPQLPSDLAFRGAILRLGDLPGSDSNSLAIEVPLSDLEVREDASTKLYSAHLSILAQIRDKKGAVLEKFSEDVPRRGALEDVTEARTEAVQFERHFIAPAGKYALEIVVLDCNSGKAGAKRINFEIPTPGNVPSLSDMVLVRRMEPFDPKADPLEPMLHGSNRITPNLSGVVTQNAKEVSIFFITHPYPAAGQTATLSVALLRNGEPLSNALATPRSIEASAATTHLATFPVSALADGDYEIKATIGQGGETAEAYARFTLMDGPADAGEPQVGDSVSLASAFASLATGPLSITFPAGPIPPPARDRLKSILEDATQRAIGYSASLPNFICVEVTKRSVDPRGDGNWKPKDSFAELLTYRDNVEYRTMLEANGQKSRTARESLDGWMSHGEFGGLLKIVFQPSSKPNFKWTGTALLGDGTVQVFDFRVARENSEFGVSAGNLLGATVGFHGQVFIDTATRSVRRITLVADDLPAKLPVRATAISVDYDYIVVNDHDFLLPIGGRLSLIQGRSEAVLNELEFRDYRHFGSTAKIVGSPSTEKP